MKIGVDLDNTIIDYSDVFAPIAVETGLLPAGHGLRTKSEVKARLRALAGDDTLWMRLQGQAYGRYIGLAKPYAGVRECLMRFREMGHSLCIVSHKTQFGHYDPLEVDLWEAARRWLEVEGLVGEGAFVLPGDLHFRVTLDKKVATIADLGLALFIDDLPKVFLHSGFPCSVKKIWFATDQQGPVPSDSICVRSWQQIMDMAGNLV